jgi:hypothetical protein
MVYPEVTELVQAGSKYWGTITDGGNGVAFRIEISQDRRVAPKVSTGKPALESRHGKTSAVADRHRIIKRVLSKNTCTKQPDGEDARITVFEIKGGSFLVVSQLGAKSHRWSRRLRVLDPVIGYWLMVNRKKPEIAKMKLCLHEPAVDHLDYLVRAAEAARRLKVKTETDELFRQCYGQMTLGEAMEEILTM